MSIAKEERNQWRERLSSPYTCFDAAHADFTIRLLDALEEGAGDGCTQYLACKRLYRY